MTTTATVDPYSWASPYVDTAARLREQLLESSDRHTRAMAQAEAAGITGLRDVWTSGA